MPLHHKVRLLLGLCVVATLSLVAPASAQPMNTGVAGPPPAAAADALIVGVTAVDKPDQTQADATRNVRLYTFLFNNSSQPQVVDWRTRRLRSPKASASISETEMQGLFVIAPGEVVLMKPMFYYQTGFPGKFTFSVRDREQRVYSVPAVPMATSAGPFGSLPAGVQQQLIQTFLASQPRDFKWWYREY